jgi:hypothetical protein
MAVSAILRFRRAQIGCDGSSILRHDPGGTEVRIRLITAAIVAVALAPTAAFAKQTPDPSYWTGKAPNPSYWTGKAPNPNYWTGKAQPNPYHWTRAQY